VRLGVYSDFAYRSDGETVSTHQAFVRFVTGLAPRLDEVVLFGRLDPRPGRRAYALPRRGVRLVALPYYPTVTSLPALIGSVRRSCRTFAAELDRLDAVWVFGPHPLAVLFALIARLRGKPLLLGVRQDYPRYIGNRLPSRMWSWAVPVAHALDWAFRMLARRSPTVVLGHELARRYAGRSRVLVTGFSLVERSELVPLEDALSKRWDGTMRLLTVGRLAPEKNPLLLVDAFADLRARNPRYRLVIAGDGPMRPELEHRIAELGLEDAVEVLGEVPNGRALWTLYRGSHAFVHVSLTEGLPQVLFEAQAAGLPIVATAVGGVQAALDGGAGGLLVKPRDAKALTCAVEALARDEALRRRLIAHGLESATRETMENQVNRLVDFIHATLPEAHASPTGVADQLAPFNAY
jgi:glycosyltransferase involved in cell wall biosynthesis